KRWASSDGFGSAFRGLFRRGTWPFWWLGGPVRPRTAVRPRGPDAHWIRRRGIRGRIRRAGTMQLYGGNPVLGENSRRTGGSAGGPGSADGICRSSVASSRPRGVAFVGWRTLCHHLSMAKTVIVKLTDDLDGGDADETVHFALDGRTYEIDLSAANAATLRETFKPFIEKGRTSSSRVRAPRVSGPPA